MDLGIEEFEDSYSSACKNRMEDMLDSYIKSLDELASLNTLKNILYGVRVVIDFRNRHLTDFAEVNLEKDPKARFFSVSITRKDIVRDVRRVMRTAGFDEMKLDEDTMTLWVFINKPTFDQRNEVALEASRLDRAVRQRVANVKRDTLERLRAAVDREYIEELDIKPTMERIEIICARTMVLIRLISIRRKKQIMGSFFVFDSKDDEELWEEENTDIFKKYFKIHDIDYDAEVELPVKITKKKPKKTEKVKQLIYVSRPTDFTNGILKNILRSSKENNVESKITGCLICRADFYFQFLEGPKEAIDELYEKILVDKRHFDIKRLRQKNANARVFEFMALKYEFNKSWMWSHDQVKNGTIHNLKSDEAMAIFEKLAKEEEARQAEAKKAREEDEKRNQMLAQRRAEIRKSAATADN
ncbi:MAG: BLUF domain-containing protein [Candidatus Puniceispirillum sp.]